MLGHLGSPDEVASIQRLDKETVAFQTTSYFGTEPIGVNFEIVNGELVLCLLTVSGIAGAQRSLWL